MARQPRIALAGRPHLVVQSIAAGTGAVIDDADRRQYVSAMLEISRETGVAIHAYALASQRVQMLATPETADALGRLMQRLGRRFVVAFNRRHGTAGPLWSSRFGATALLSERYSLSTLLMIEQMPVAEGCSLAPADWPWSSAAHHLGLRTDSRLADPACYWALGNTPFDRHARYASLLQSQLPESLMAELEAAARAGWPLGSASELAAAQKALAGRALRPRPRGRPRAVD